MKKKFLLQGLDCANCAAKMENAIGRLNGVKEASVNFLTQRLTIVGEDEKMPAIVDEAQKVIAKIESRVVLKRA